MERLTVSGAITQKDIDKLMELSDENQFGRNAAYYKLQLYEDLEEQGLLLRLPCKVGAPIWIVDNFACDGALLNPPKMREAGFNHHLLEFMGKTVFLTRAEAEARLKHLRSRFRRNQLYMLMAQNIVQIVIVTIQILAVECV